MLNLKAIKEARGRIRPYIYETPLLRLPDLDQYAGCRVYAKLESLQKTNSFKVRGAFNALLTMSEEAKARGVIAASSGNHGKGIAYAARELGVEARVVMPDNAPNIKVEGIRGLEAEIIFAKPPERFSLAQELAAQNSWPYISPYDNNAIMAGQGTAGLEILEELPDVDYVVIPIGGGGLLGGLATAFKGMASGVKVIGAEPAQVARYSASFAAGRPLALPPDSYTVADGLRTLEAGRLNYPLIKKYVDEIVTVTDENILRATKLFLTKGKQLAEISSCITLGALLQGAVRPSPGDSVVLFISGGNIGMDQFDQFADISI